MKNFSASCIVASAVLFAGPALPAQAELPPWEGCRAATKAEYDGAKREYLLRTRFGAYVRTGSLLRRRYWYCHQ